LLGFALLAPPELAKLTGGNGRATSVSDGSSTSWGQVPPPACGFRVRSRGLDLVDLGTSFGINVPHDGPGEVHVFDGKVQIAPPGQPAAMREIEGGQSITFDHRGGSRAIAQAPKAFVTIADLDRIETEAAGLRLGRWFDAATRLRTDPSLLVHFTFESESLARRVINHAGFDNTGPAGTLVGGQQATGRWPGKAAVAFRRVSDRVRLADPGEYDSLTMVVWARVDSLPNEYHGLVMTDGFTVGYPHWQIRRSGRVSFSVRHQPQGDFFQTLTPPVILPETFGQWVSLAVVYDATARRVTQFLNGRAVADMAIEHSVRLRLDTSELGNWGLTSHGGPSAIRNFVGSMDEFLLFGRALSAREIEQMFASGDPYRPFATAAP